MGLLLWLTKYKDPKNAYRPVGSNPPVPKTAKPPPPPNPPMKT